MGPPEIMYDEDSRPIAVLVRVEVDTPKKAFRAVAEEHDWFLDDFPCVDLHEDGSVYRPKFSEYKIALGYITEGWMRPWREGDEEYTEFGREAWFWCTSHEDGAVAYWDLQGVV